MANSGVSKLAQVIAERISSQTQRPDALELGTIQTTTDATVGDHGIHNHDVPRPLQLAPLSPGDRVLVAWVNDGMDPIVIDVVVNS